MIALRGACVANHRGKEKLPYCLVMGEWVNGGMDEWSAKLPNENTPNYRTKIRQITEKNIKNICEYEKKVVPLCPNLVKYK